MTATDWKTQGIRVIAPHTRSGDTPDTRGMNRQVAISGARTGSQALWAGTNHIRPGTITGPHHHGPLESVIYVVSGTALMRWGDRLEFITRAGPGSFLLVPPFMPHQELNASDTEDLHCALVRSGPEEIVVNLPDIKIEPDPEWIEF